MSKKINLHAPFNTLGFGIFSYLYYKMLKTEGYEVSWDVIGNPSAEDMNSICAQFNLNPINPDELDGDMVREKFKHEPSLTIWHPHEINKGTTSPSIGVTHFETSLLLAHEVGPLNQMDKTFCCSDWGIQTMLRSGVQPGKAGVIPGICAPMHIDYDNYTFSGADPFSRIADHILNEISAPEILSICSVGKWELRKDQIAQCEALSTLPIPTFTCAFWNNVFLDNLVGSVSHLHKNGWQRGPHIVADDLRVTTWGKKDAIIALFPFLNDMREMQRIMRYCDVFLSSSRGEGWNQPLVEAMGLGLPVIATNCTAHTAYLTTDNAILLDCSPEIADDGIWFKGNRGNWYPTTVGRVREALYQASEMKREGILKDIGIQAAHDIKNLCSTEHVIHTLEDSFMEIYK